MQSLLCPSSSLSSPPPSSSFCFAPALAMPMSCHVLEAQFIRITL
jgi:hypothetical protein